ncbi:MAG: DNA adenine methylase [Acidimicrobiales bacterium]|jgi:adenine-specific DNA-methyltransferase
MIKYLGSKRRLVPTLAAMATSIGGRTALDLFSGTARVGRALKQAGMQVTAVDSATYAYVLAQTYVATDAREVDSDELADALASLSRLPGRAGYVTDVFCEQSRYFHPDNGRRIDAIRDAIEEAWAGSFLYPLLLTSLLEAADRVDSTTGLQMAYLKQWAPRALSPLELRAPALVPGPGEAVMGDASHLVAGLGHFDVAYLDPPYNQHRYFGNYHVWETLVRWDAPDHYGVACKRVDCRDDATASPFNRRREMPVALASVIADVDAELLLVSYNDESWLSADDLVAMCRRRLDQRAGPQDDATVAILGLDQPRYVGARIGIHNPAGEKVGTVSHLRNTELIVAAGPREAVRRAVRAGLLAAAGSGLEAEEMPV